MSGEGKRARHKGDRAERQAVNALQAAGIAAERIPLSGAAGGSFSGDISAPVQGIDRTFESKCRANGFTQIYSWIDGNYGLILKADRKAQLVVLRLEDFAELAR